MKARVPVAAHVFVVSSGQALPRWLEAFPALRCVKPGTPLGPLDATTLIWLRIDSLAPTLPQVQELTRVAPGALILVLADQPDDNDALPLFSAGIRAYCNAHSTAANLRQVAQVVRAGGLWIGPGLMARLLTATQRALPPPVVDAQADPRLTALTGREMEVARKIAGGASNKEVARDLNITERTVKAHAGAIFEKLGARDRLHLALIMNGRDPNAGSAPAAGGGESGGKGGKGEATRKQIKRVAGSSSNSAVDEEARNTPIAGVKACPTR